MSNIYIKDLIQEDFVNYKTPCMFISTCFCDWKCCKEADISIDTCQNHKTIQNPNLNISIESIYERYINNPITKALVIGGLEPIKQYTEIINLIHYFRTNNCQDDIVIYTGYYPYEILDILEYFVSFNNIVFKFGRYIPDRPPVFDKTLGVKLASDNQYGVRMTKDKELAQYVIQSAKDRNGHCPCMVKDTENTLCCCLAFRKQEQGICHCGLWEKL